MKKIYLHPLPLRIWHWANALTVILLVITGIQLRIHGVPALRSNSPALLVHRVAGWSMAISFLFWLVYSVISDNLRRHYAIKSLDFKGAFRQARFYLFSMFRGEESPFQPSPDERFNPLQKLAYGAIMCVFTPALLATGVLFSDVPLLRKFVLRLNVMKGIDAIHVIGAYVFVLYLIVHLYMATLGRQTFSHIKAMIVGYEEEPDEPGILVSGEEELDKPGSTSVVIPPGEAVASRECQTGQEGTKING
jgi:thiosulfate reductase cytochrome b subunit